MRTDHVCADYCDFRLHSLSGALFLYFSSADLVPHHFGMPEPRAFRFGMVQFLRTAFGLPIVQWKSLVTICPVSSVLIWGEPLVRLRGTYVGYRGSCALRMNRHQSDFLSAPQSVSRVFLETDRGAFSSANSVPETCPIRTVR